MPKGDSEMVPAAIRTDSPSPTPSTHAQRDVIAGMLGRQFPAVATTLRDARDELLASALLQPRPEAQEEVAQPALIAS